jgi:hypothetical protein
LHVTYRTVALVAAVAGLFAAASALRSADRETATLRVFDGAGQDHYASLWVVDDPEGFTWIRADEPTERWLSVVERNPEVELRRHGRSRHYTARIFDTPEARAHVRGRFRAKYGWADRWREWRHGRDTIPIRLRSR